jgi:hypothetical protein
LVQNEVVRLEAMRLPPPLCLAVVVAMMDDGSQWVMGAPWPVV